MPDADERIRPQQRHHLLPEREIERRIAKHRGRVDGEIEQQPLHALRVMQHFLGQTGDRREPLGINPLPHATPKRRNGVVAKVEAVVTEDAFRQKFDLDAFEIVLAGFVGG